MSDKDELQHQLDAAEDEVFWLRAALADSKQQRSLQEDLINEWQERAEKAEAEVKKLQAELEQLQEQTATAWRKSQSMRGSGGCF